MPIEEACSIASFPAGKQRTEVGSLCENKLGVKLWGYLQLDRHAVFIHKGYESREISHEGDMEIAREGFATLEREPHQMAPAVGIALVVGFLSLLLVLKTLVLSQKRLPPGPRPLPIIGNLLLMNKYESIFDLAIDLKRSYGPIVTLWMGSKPAIIISGPEIIQQAMIKQGNVFIDRNRLESLYILNNEFRGLKTAVPERFRFLRKLMVSEIFSSGRVAGFKGIRHEEIDIFIENLKEVARGNGGLVTNFRSLVRLAVFNMIMGICVGRRLTLDEYSRIDKVLDIRFKMQLGKTRDFIPLLRLFPDKKGEETQRKLKKTVDDHLMPLIEERRRVLSSGSTPERHTFVDTLLALQSGQHVEALRHTDSDIVNLCLELLNAGTDTTSLNLEYTIANLINHPEIQEKLFEEIDAVVGEKVVDEDDIPRLPYLQAVVKESLRRHTPARFALDRQAVHATKLAGYDIPAKALVFQHLEAVAMDPQIWEKPLEFKPERFLGKSLDLTGSMEITMIPFGVGRRICPAVNVALLHAHLILARLVQGFEWKPAVAGQVVDLSADISLTAPMLYPLTALVLER